MKDPGVGGWVVSGPGGVGYWNTHICGCFFFATSLYVLNYFGKRTLVCPLISIHPYYPLIRVQ